MLTNIFSRFRLDYDGNYSVKKINIYLLRLLYLLIFFGKSQWRHTYGNYGSLDRMEGIVWCVWASSFILRILGIIHPLKILSIILLEILSKVICLLAWHIHYGQRDS